jgi:diguanylate cyclase (GGDEF)-like protein
MENKEKETEKEFIANPKIMEHYNFLQRIGVFSYIDSLARNIYHYKTLLSRGLDIFNRSSITEIMDAAVGQISYDFLPSYIAFLWKPLQNRSEITIRAYRNYKPFDMGLNTDNITLFDSFFKNSPKPVNFKDITEKMGDNTEALAPFREVQPEIVIPILGPLGLYGVILVGRKVMKDDYALEEIDYLHQLMSFVSQAIKNLLHYEHSLRDVKTGLYNHGYFMARLKEEVAQKQRDPFTSSVIVIDVDKFKYFNDTYGHLAGDQVLENLAYVIKQNVRVSDIPARFGGEEFTVLLPHTEIPIAWMAAERLRTKVAEMQVPWEVPLPQVTISLGVFSFDHNSNLEPTAILRHADEALYVSKARGRNRSTIWEPNLLVNISAQAEKVH